ncbi:Fe2OG dioxygenase domain-containing protein [Fusarium sp. Ph1]|nr:Fe2OG dioxygenase domain-containing protein [Fusarium sp. Ph1]
MATEIFPVIDLSAGDDWPQTLGPKIVEACQVWGFMILTGHEIPQQKIDHMFDLHKEFCAQPLEVKSECRVDERQLGYDVKNSKIAVNECMVFGGTKGDVAQGKNIPSCWDARKRADVEDFKSQAHKLGLKLLEVFATHFSLPADYFSAAHNDERGPGSVLRMLHYPKLEERPDKNFPRLYSHTDWGSVTFVWPQGGGLEVETPSKKWMPVPLIPGSIALTAGEYHQVRHYMSEKEDAKNNWVGKTEASSKFDPRVIHAVENLGIANGSGLVNFSPIAVKQ